MSGIKFFADVALHLANIGDSRNLPVDFISFLSSRLSPMQGATSSRRC
ncbi:hypothetical protein OH687_17780 [Burkholderia anthina]|nr:hypothetical protein OH687_17780 [Burkholderia anthina]